MSHPVGYSVHSYGDMISSHQRMDAYVAALREAVRPGCTVLDIGAGTGIFSLLACQFGAGRVHAAEPNDAIHLARSLAAENGFANRIVFHQDLSTAITLPKRADVIVSDLRSILPLLQQHIPSILDARNRLLAPSGILIPKRDRLWASLVNAPKFYGPFSSPWLTNPFDLDMRAGHPLVVNTWSRERAKPDQLLVAPTCWATLDYQTIECPNVSGDVTWTLEQPCTTQGLLQWFDTDLAEGIGFSNAPGQPDGIYAQAFFPFQEPIDLAAGERLEVLLAANLVGDDYVWRWTTSVFPQADPTRPRLRFEQSTFFATLLTPDRLHRREAGYVPPKTRTAEIDRCILEQFDGQTSLGAIAEQLAKRFPQDFRRTQDAISRVGEVAERYHR